MRTKENFSEKSLKNKRHLIRQKLLSILLCVCLLLASLSEGFYDLKVQAEETSRKIHSFFELPEEVREQTVETETKSEELNLPKSLQAVCVSTENIIQNENDSIENRTVENTDVNINAEETVVIENLTWTSNPTYDSETEGVYIFTPTLPEPYILEEGVNLPEIHVTVKGTKREKEIIEEIDLETERTEEQIKDEMKTEIKNETEISPLSVEAEGAVDPSGGVIQSDTTWKAGKLRNCTVTIPKDVTLRINNLSIEGNVIFKGGGTVTHAGNPFGITLTKDSTLTLEDVTLDGAGIDQWNVTLLYVGLNARLNLKKGCIIQNVNIYNENSKEIIALIWEEYIPLTINGGTFKNNRVEDGSVSAWRCGISRNRQ